MRGLTHTHTGGSRMRPGSTVRIVSGARRTNRERDRGKERVRVCVCVCRHSRVAVYPLMHLLARCEDTLNNIICVQNNHTHTHTHTHTCGDALSGRRHTHTRARARVSGLSAASAGPVFKSGHMLAHVCACKHVHALTICVAVAQVANSVVQNLQCNSNTTDQTNRHSQPEQLFNQPLNPAQLLPSTAAAVLSTDAACVWRYTHVPLQSLVACVGSTAYAVHVLMCLTMCALRHTYLSSVS